MQDSDQAQYVCFRGVKDELPQGSDGSYGTSLTLAKALDPANDILVAYRQNGRLLTPDHGYPVRMIIPGHIGGRMVKYVEEITVTPKESDNFYHYFDNRVLPSHVDAELAKKEGAGCCPRGWVLPTRCTRARTPFSLQPISTRHRVVVQARLYHQRPQHQQRHRRPPAQRGGAPHTA